MLVNEVIFRIENESGLKWRKFELPVKVLRANRVDEVPPTIEEAENHAAQGNICAGFVSYEAASAFNPSLSTMQADQYLPLAWFGVYDQWQDLDELPHAFVRSEVLSQWTPGLSEADYAAVLAQIHDLIGNGDTYQVNFTFRLHDGSRSSPKSLFAAMASCNKTKYSAFLADNDWEICCASPELFFELDGDAIRTKPMKGTAPRGINSGQDLRLADALRRSEKDRAENLMIVDMARNDLGKIARVGSVEVSKLFEIERYATVQQMTSTIEAKTDAPITDIFRALFPAASITGAPKKRTMEIIRDFERSPRGVYTGCIGTIGPGRKARFNVAIRTAVLDKSTKEWEYGVGGGIVWDSAAESEYEECRTKAAVLSNLEPDFKLLETMRWSPEQGYFLLERHMARLMSSADYFDFTIDESEILNTLQKLALQFDRQSRVRLQVDKNGKLEVESAPFAPWPIDRPITIALASKPIDPKDRFLYHKTTYRKLYDEARAEYPECDEVLLWNPEGFITEGTFSNVALKLNGILITPTVECGLLPGTLRAELLEIGELEEGLIRAEDLEKAEALYLLNSVRGMARTAIAVPAMTSVR